jgi:O-antigen ligase
MHLIGPLVYVAALLLAPWAFGAVTPQAVWALTVTLLGLSVWRLLEVLSSRDDSPTFIPLASLVPLVLILVGIYQLLPAEESLVPRMTHAVHADLAATYESLGSGRTLSGTLTRTATAKVFFGLLTFLLGAQWFATPRARQWLLGALLVNGAALGFFGIIQSLTWNGMLFWTVPLRFGGTPFASFVNRNNAAGYLNLCLAAGAGWLLMRAGTMLAGRVRGVRTALRPASLRVRILWWIAGLNGVTLGIFGLIVLVCAAVASSLSRGGGVAMLAGIAAALCGVRLVSRWSAVLLTVALALLAVGFVVWTGRGSVIDERLQTLGNPWEVAEGRLRHWRDTFGAVRDFPVTGTGLGTYGYANLPYQREESHAWYLNADNLFFELLVETGVVGGSAFVAGFVLLGVTSVSLLRRTEPSAQAVGATGLVAAVTQAVQSTTDFGLLLPANALTFLALAGSVCGTACSVANYDRSRIPVWLCLARADHRPSKLLASLVLAVSAGMFSLELLAATHAEYARNVVLPADSGRTRIGQFDELLEGAQAALRYRPDDAELHRSIGLWWIDRYRLAAFEELRKEAGDDPVRARELWQATSVAVLHARILQLQQTGETAQAARLRALPIVQENLVDAQRHLQLAESLAPLSRDIQVPLAQLTLLDQSVDPEVHLRRGLFLAASQSDELLEVGAMAEVIGDRELADRALFRCLEVSPAQRVEVWSLLAARPSAEPLWGKVVPDRIDVLVDLAERVFDEESRRRLVERASKLVKQMNKSDLAILTDDLRARLADLSGDRAEALRLYQSALQRSPREIEWRLRVARILRETGRWAEADTQYSLVRGLAPNRKDIENEQREFRSGLFRSGPEASGAPESALSPAGR